MEVPWGPIHCWGTVLLCSAIRFRLCVLDSEGEGLLFAATHEETWHSRCQYGLLIASMLASMIASRIASMIC